MTTLRASMALVLVGLTGVALEGRMEPARTPAAPYVAATPAPAPPTPPTSEDLRRAEASLASFQRTYRHLEDVTVSEGTTPEGHQAVSYYTKGEIVLSPSHTASVEDIIAHEVWHVIDWRDNGRLDWGETIPPDNRADYLK